jgi:lipid A 3-O-deacylase
VAGLPAWLNRQPGQVRKEAATAIDASAGGQARHPLFLPVNTGVLTHAPAAQFFHDSSLASDCRDRPTAGAVSGSSIELGSGDDSTRMARVAVALELGQAAGKSARTGTPPASGKPAWAFWKGDEAGARNLWEVGFTPVFRLSVQRRQPFFLEGAIGATPAIRRPASSNRRGFGSSFNFGDYLGFGWMLWRQDRYELGYRFQHISNADMAEPNDGINLHQIRLGYNY